MRRSLWILAFAASLCLNVGFGAAWFMKRAHHRRPPDLATQLGLASPQKETFEANFAALKQRLASLDQELDQARRELLDLLASENPSPEAIHAKQEAVLEIQQRIQEAVSTHLLKQKQLLTPDQQKRFFDHLRRRMDGPDRRPPTNDMEKPK